MCTFNRSPYFANHAIGARVREQLLTIAAAWEVEVVAYCLMPDHLHALFEGQTDRADSRKCADTFRRTSAFYFRQEHRRRLWQEGYFDRVLRSEEATLDVVGYIVLNPTKAGLCADPRDYLLSGSTRYDVSELLTANQWAPRSLG
jgi:REP element-mobilizing transposase RayT